MVRTNYSKRARVRTGGLSTSEEGGALGNLSALSSRSPSFFFHSTTSYLQIHKVAPYGCMKLYSIHTPSLNPYNPQNSIKLYIRPSVTPTRPYNNPYVTDCQIS